MTMDDNINKSNQKLLQRVGQSGNGTIFDDELVSVKEIIAVLKIGHTKWWDGVRCGIYPRPIKLGNRCTRWTKSSIERLMQKGVETSELP